ncbi:hypothetical protein AGDE_08518 [Angomonas deanei]|nr:hypothetical protein AGDE_08518 [Angomonas deanei]|eukprot:EPY32615.1 hypothetical protein AGDE_08518 [Angomonas deanei]
MQYISFASGSLFLFFVARLLSGLFKHEKTLLSKVGSTFEGLGERVGWASFLGTFGGLLAAGYLADHVPDGVRIMYIIFMMELLAAGCLLIAYAQSAHVPIDRTRDAHYTTFVKNTFRSDSNRRHLGYLLLLTCAASVYQCMYAVLPTKSFGLPNLFTGGHYVVSLVAQSTVSKFVVGRLPGSPHRILQYALSVLFIGFLVVDYAQERGPFVYYPVSLLTIDIPAGVATIACTKLILQNVKKTETALMSRLVRHTILTAKLFGVPLRICLTEFLLNGSVAAALLAVPSIVFMLCVLAGCSKNMTVSSTVLTVSAVLSQLYF